MIKTKWLQGEQGSVYNDALNIRKEVFVKEQQVDIDLEIDGMDSVAWHIVVYNDDTPIACGRLLKEGNVHIGGRIAVLPNYRGKKYGDLIMRMLIRKAYNDGGGELVVHAQISAKGFYEKLGFTSFGEEYLDAGIKHIDMRRKGDITGDC